MLLGLEFTVVTSLKSNTTHCLLAMTFTSNPPIWAKIAVVVWIIAAYSVYPGFGPLLFSFNSRIALSISQWQSDVPERYQFIPWRYPQHMDYVTMLGVYEIWEEELLGTRPKTRYNSSDMPLCDGNVITPEVMLDFWFPRWARYADLVTRTWAPRSCKFQHDNVPHLQRFMHAPAFWSTWNQATLGNFVLIHRYGSVCGIDPRHIEVGLHRFVQWWSMNDCIDVQPEFDV